MWACPVWLIHGADFTVLAGIWSMYRVGTGAATGCGTGLTAWTVLVAASVVQRLGSGAIHQARFGMCWSSQGAGEFMLQC